MSTTPSTEQLSTNEAGDEQERAAPDERIRGRRFQAWLKKLPKKLGLLALAVLITVAALEGVFRLFGYRPLYDEYSKPDTFFVHDRVLGWRNKPGAHDEFVGPVPFPVEFRTSIRLNSLGFRGGEIKDVPPGGKRVVVIGDSQAAGFEVPERRTYEALLQRQLTDALGTPAQVINAGVRGYGTDQELLEYERQVRQLHPDLVVLHFSANDPDDNTTLHRTRRPFGKSAFAPRSDGSLHLVDIPVRDYPECSAYRLDDTYHLQRVDSLRSRSFCWIESRLTDRSALFSFITTRIRTNPTLLDWFHGLGSPGDQEAVAPPKPAPEKKTRGSSAPSTATPAPASSTEATPATTSAGASAATVQGTDYRDVLTSRLILRLASEVQQDGAKLVIATQDIDLAGLDVAAFEQAGINIVRVDQALGPDQNAVRFPNDGHFNARGHRAVATSLLRPLAYLLAR
jgi:GDSL-like Lipase/Acylhydrolase family